MNDMINVGTRCKSVNDCVKKECVEACHRLLFLTNTHSKVRVKEDGSWEILEILGRHEQAYERKKVYE